MRTYTAHLEPTRTPILVREGWSWPALFFGPLWLLASRAWIPALLEIAFIAAVLTLAPPALRPVLMIALCILNALLGHDLVRWSLARRGYTLAHVVMAPNPDAALLRLLTARPDLTAQIQ